MSSKASFALPSFFCGFLTLRFLRRVLCSTSGRTAFACFSISSKFSRMPQTNCRSELCRFVHVVNKICVVCRALLTLWNCLSNVSIDEAWIQIQIHAFFAKGLEFAVWYHPFQWLSAATMWEKVSLMVIVYTSLLVRHLK